MIVWVSLENKNYFFNRSNRSQVTGTDMVSSLFLYCLDILNVYCESKCAVLSRNIALAGKSPVVRSTVR